MQKLILNIFIFIIKAKANKAAYQHFFTMLHTECLKAMNYGTSGNVLDSGEIETLMFVNKNLNSECIVFDVGANEGSFAKMALNIFSENLKLFCFEPQKHIFDKLEKRFDSRSNVQCFNFGLSDSESLSMMYGNDAISGISSVYHRWLDHFKIDFKL